MSRSRRQTVCRADCLTGAGGDRNPAARAALASGPVVALLAAMTNTNKAIKALRNILLPAALLLSSGTIGCATVGAGHSDVRGRDVHVSASLSGGAARAIVSGPATLLHVDVAGANDLSLYRVARTDGDACAAAAKRGPATELRRGASNRVNIDVGADEIICVAAATAGRGASLTWHARSAQTSTISDGRLLAANDRD